MHAGGPRTGASSTGRRLAELLLAWRQHSAAWLVTNIYSFVFFKEGQCGRSFPFMHVRIDSGQLCSRGMCLLGTKLVLYAHTVALHHRRASKA